MALHSSKLNKILLPSVLLIWVLLGMRFMGFFEANTEVTEAQQELKFSENIALDTFSLLLNYPDPFLGDLPNSTPKSAKPRISSAPKLIPVKIKEPIDIPKLQYQGHVQNDSLHATAILRIDNKLISVREGQRISGLWIKSISPERVEIALKDTLISVVR